MENNIYKLSKDSSNIVEIVKHATKAKDGTYGDYWIYNIKKDNQDHSMFVNSKRLHEILLTFGAGKIVNISKDEYAPGKSVWNATPQGKVKPNIKIDARTHDIHKQVCLKLAMELISKKDSLLTSAELIIIEGNMLSLLDVLEGGTSIEPTVVPSPKPEEIGEKDNFPF